MSDERRTETIAGASSGAPPPGLPPGHLVAGRWEIASVAGSGGFAVVYEALDRRLGERVALKILRTDRLGARSLRRLEREVALARRIDSPHVIRVFDLGETEAGPFLTMELVAGASLRERLRAAGPLPVGEAVRLARGVLGGLAALHALGIVHRDIKPGNILITPDGTPKIADFGLAREWESGDATTAGDGFAGTVEYISPEQALGRDVGPASDLYSCGVVLYEMLTGVLPFEGSSLAAVVGHVRERPRPVRSLRPEVPRWLAQIVERLLAKRPEDRHASAAEAMRALEARRWRLDGRSRRRLAIAAVAAVTAAGSILALRHGSAPRFDRLAHEAGVVSALDEEGRSLWSLSVPGSQRRWAAVLKDGKRARVATLRSEGTGFALETRDAEDGSLLGTLSIPDGAPFFPGFERAFGPGVTMPIDIDRDGRDEVVASFTHTFWPSYLAWADPTTGTTRLVLLAGGHQAPVAAIDLTRDGHPELIFIGTANRLGWFAGVGAIDLHEGLALPGALPVSTPDDVRARASADGTLLWYALLPSRFADAQSVRIEPGTPGVVVRLAGGEAVRLDDDGFLAGSRSSLDPAARRGAREEAYALMRRASRGMAARSGVAALESARRAAALARAAGDPYLAEWCERSEAALLVAVGQTAAATAAFERLYAGSEAAGDVAYDAATAFHLAGALDDAVRWYERGLLDDGKVGRLQWEFLLGLVLALCEDERWDDALSAVMAYREAGKIGGLADQAFELYVRWRSGRPVAPREEEAPSGIHFLRYVRLESRLAAGESPAALLAEVEREAESGGELTPLFGMLLAEILDRSGRREEAAALATRWAAEAAQRRERDVIYRALHPVVEERRARLAR